MTTLRYKLFGIGKLPEDMRAGLEAEGALHVYEGVPATYEFSGKLPGLFVKGTNTRRYSGAIALTKKRILGTLSVVPNGSDVRAPESSPAHRRGARQHPLDTRLRRSRCFL